MKKAKYSVALAFWLVLEWVCTASAGAAIPPYPLPPEYATPVGCYDTIQMYEGDQFGHTETASIVLTVAESNPEMIHIVVSAKAGFWLLQVRSGWIGPNGPDGFAWNNPGQDEFRSYQHDAYGAGIGIIVVTCPDSMLVSEPTTTSTATSPGVVMTPAPSTTTPQPPTSPVQPVIVTPNFTG